MKSNAKAKTTVKSTAPAATTPASVKPTARANVKATAMNAVAGHEGAKPTVKTAEAALALIRKNGVITFAARIEGVSCFVEAVAGERIAGSWWGHPKGKLIFALAEGLEDSDEVLSLRLLEGKATFLARDLWPVLLAVVLDARRRRAGCGRRSRPRPAAEKRRGR